MAIKTPASFVPPANAIAGGGAGKPLTRVWERHITDDGLGEVNFADALCKLNDPLSGEAINVNVDVASPIFDEPAFTEIDFNSRKLIYEADFQTGFDTYNDWTCFFNGSLLGENRTATAVGAGNDTLTYDSLNGELQLTFDAATAPIVPYVNESKTYLKLRGTGKSYSLFNGTYEHIGDALGNTTAFSIQHIGSPAVPQASWNVDALDGTGASGIDLDFTKTQALVIESNLDVRGEVAFCFLIDSALYYAHRFKVTNTVADVSTMNLPMRDQISRIGGEFIRQVGLFNDTTGFVFASTMDTTTSPALIVSQSLSGAKTYKVTTDEVERRLPFSATTGATSRVVTAADTHVLSLTSQNEFDAFPGPGAVPNRTVWDIDQIQLYASGPDLEKACYISVRYNATLANETFVRLINNEQSRVLQNTDIATTLSAPGLEIFSARILTNQIYTFKKEEIFSRFRNAFGRNKIIASGVDGVLNHKITIVATPMDATDTLEVAATIIGGEVG